MAPGDSIQRRAASSQTCNQNMYVPYPYHARPMNAAMRISFCIGRSMLG